MLLRASTRQIDYDAFIAPWSVITTSVLNKFAAISKAHFSAAYRLRHAELQAAGAAFAQVTIESLLAELEAARAKATISELEEARAKATDLNQLSAAVRATAEKAKISGLLTQKFEVEVSQAEAGSFPPPFWVESDFPR